METMKVTVHIGSDGILKLEMPTSLKNVDTEVVLVLQAQSDELKDKNGYPLKFFEALDAIKADDVVERP